ncbi:MAG: hypothetical protein HYW77_02985 [Parcubacteria group bacterium]|nr:hypothetical protein [Parcubacteria group bacterium]
MELQKLYQQVDRCKFCKAERNKLQHIHGYGAMNPKLMLILINPTYRNLSSDSRYLGDRFPFIGVRQFWKVLADGGVIDKKVAYGLPLRKNWNDNHTEQIKRELVGNKLFLTNIVKCCYNHSAYPAKAIIKEQLKLLAEEIKTVKPKAIVAFGGLVYKTLTGKSIRLADYQNGSWEKIAEAVSGLGIPVMPCYFPIGRGNPGKAAEILRQSA